MKKLLLGIVFMLSLSPLMSQSLQSQSSDTPPSFSILSTQSYQFDGQDLEGLMVELETADLLESFDIFNISFKDSIFVHDIGDFVQIYDIIRYKYDPENNFHINLTVKSRKTGSTYTYEYFEYDGKSLFIIMGGCMDSKCSGISYKISKLRQLND